MLHTSCEWDPAFISQLVFLILYLTDDVEGSGVVMQSEGENDARLRACGCEELVQTTLLGVGQR